MRAVALMTLALCAAACADDDDTRPATIAYIAPAIFAPMCATASCHSSLTRAGGLVLDDPPARVRARLVEKQLLYEPPMTSYSPFMNFLTGEFSGFLMPPDLPLSAGDLALIRRWLDAGAP